MSSSSLHNPQDNLACCTVETRWWAMGTLSLRCSPASSLCTFVSAILHHMAHCSCPMSSSSLHNPQDNLACCTVETRWWAMGTLSLHCSPASSLCTFVSAILHRMAHCIRPMSSSSLHNQPVQVQSSLCDRLCNRDSQLNRRRL